ncbi:hypothetical protein SETIT_3G341100v2 [Setaria italica]|uniref:Uncharacterized protein n=1 Tax=Setaria italica TaxID=4555 RepID=A0A368QM00_SETIT|nr:hypothetical protein SETIT_3G341100v2 [Setaria italica]
MIGLTTSLQIAPYDDRHDAWPICHHDVACVVQLFDGYSEEASVSFDARMACLISKKEIAAMRSGLILHFLSQHRSTSTTSSARSLTSSLGWRIFNPKLMQILGRLTSPVT